MKKGLFLSIMMLIIVLITGCGESSNLKEITYSELKTKMTNKETFILEVMREDCINCEEFSPKLEEITKEHNLTIYVINTNKLTEAEYTEFDKTLSISGTPTLIFITEGVEQSVAQRLEGNQTRAKVIERLKSMGYIAK